jgi:hypothetical protein
MLLVKLNEKLEKFFDCVLFILYAEETFKILLNHRQLSLGFFYLDTQESIVMMTKFLHHDLEAFRALPDIPIFQFTFYVFDGFVVN